jgi:crotonobetainyl-CoA:carnitine CoA-transferase CaiB-like acyl-CoA transferase
LKVAAALEKVKALIKTADVMIHNFRPGVIERIGLDFETVKSINPRLVYGVISGYGDEGPWREKPGQDLLVQSMSGLAYLSGDATQGPVPMGLAIADMFSGAHLVQGILACLVRRGITNQGALVEVSLMESILDYQFEVLTTYLNDGHRAPQRSSVNNAHAYLGAPYGIYQTQDGFLALAMGPLLKLGELIGLDLSPYSDPKTWFIHRDDIKTKLREHLLKETTLHWLSVLEPADYWCAEVFTWDKLFSHEGFKVLNMTQTIELKSGSRLETLRCPIRIDGERLFSSKGAPKIGEDNQKILQELEVNT